MPYILDMTVNLSIETDNAAFSNGFGTAEVARILKRAAAHVEAYGSLHDFDGFDLIDINGNKVGQLDIIE
jgi:hypothetical protein